MDALNGMKTLMVRSRKEDVTRNAFKKMEDLHLPSLLKTFRGHMNLKDATIRSAQTQIDPLITKQWVTIHLDIPEKKDFVTLTVGMRQFRRVRARGLVYSPVIWSHPNSCRCEDSGGSCSTGDSATEDWPGKLALLGRRKTFEVPVAVAKVKKLDRCTSMADWEQNSTFVTADSVRADTTAKEGRGTSIAANNTETVEYWRSDQCLQAG